jgi:hypothetical protein
MFLWTGRKQWRQAASPPETRRVVHFQIQHDVLEPHGGAVLFAMARLRLSDDGQRFRSALAASGFDLFGTGV